jgi:hypothetical protein
MCINGAIIIRLFNDSVEYRTYTPKAKKERDKLRQLQTVNFGRVCVEASGKSTGIP